MSGGAQDVGASGRRVLWSRLGTSITGGAAVLGVLFAGVEAFREDRVVIQSAAGDEGPAPVATPWSALAQPSASASVRASSTASASAVLDAGGAAASASAPRQDAPEVAPAPAAGHAAPAAAAPTPARTPAGTTQDASTAPVSPTQASCNPTAYHYRAYNRTGQGASRVAGPNQMVTQSFAATGDRISEIWVNVGLDDGVTTSGTDMDYRIQISVVSAAGTELGSSSVSAWTQHGFARFTFRNVSPLACGETYRLRISNVGDKRLVVYGFPADEYPKGSFTGGDPASSAVDGNLQICRDACDAI